jgi:CRP-like cAMP-binding protein
MPLDDDIRILSGVNLFEGFTTEQLRLLAFGAEGMRLSAGKDLYEEGAAADSGYVIARGRVVLYRERDGERTTVGHAGIGAILGELALIADTTRFTSARAETDTDLIRLNRKLFRRILEEYPDLAVMLHRRIVDELQAMASRIGDLAPRFRAETD